MNQLIFRSQFPLNRVLSSHLSSWCTEFTRRWTVLATTGWVDLIRCHCRVMIRVQPVHPNAIVRNLSVWSCIVNVSRGVQYSSILRIILSRVQLWLLPKHGAIQWDPCKSNRWDADSIQPTFRIQDIINQGLQLQEDRLPEKVLWMLRVRSQMQRILQMLQLRKLSLTLYLYSLLIAGRIISGQ